jgi:hypothetical protein
MSKNYRLIVITFRLIVLKQEYDAAGVIYPFGAS